MFGQEKAQTQAAHAQGAPRVRMTRPRLVAASPIRGERKEVTTEGREATRYAKTVGNQQKWHSVRPERSGAGMGSRKLP